MNSSGIQRIAVGIAAVVLTTGCSDGRESGTPSTTSTIQSSSAVLELSQTDGLIDGQVVEFSGHGFTPGKNLSLAQCTVDSAGPTQCHLSGGLFVRVDPDGTIAGEIAVVTGSIGVGHPCDADNPCSIGTADINDPTGPDHSRVIISFA